MAERNCIRIENQNGADKPLKAIFDLQAKRFQDTGQRLMRHDHLEHGFVEYGKRFAKLLLLRFAQFGGSGHNNLFELRFLVLSQWPQY